MGFDGAARTFLFRLINKQNGALRAPPIAASLLLFYPNKNIKSLNVRDSNSVARVMCLQIKCYLRDSNSGRSKFNENL